MKDPEFIVLRNRFLIAVCVTIAFTVPVLLFMFKSFRVELTDVLKGLNKKEDMLIYVESDNCTNCSNIENILKKEEIDYKILNINDNSDYVEIMRKLGISKDVVEVPSLIYVKNGEMVANVMNLKTESDIFSFLEAHDISNDNK